MKCERPDCAQNLGEDKDFNSQGNTDEDKSAKKQGEGSKCQH